MSHFRSSRIVRYNKISNRLTGAAILLAMAFFVWLLVSNLDALR